MPALRSPILPVAAACVVTAAVAGLAVVGVGPLALAVADAVPLLAGLVAVWLALALAVDLRAWPRYSAGRRRAAFAGWAAVGWLAVLAVLS